MTQVWFLSDRKNEIADWIDDNLEDCVYWYDRLGGSRRFLIVIFHTEDDETLFQLRWQGVANLRLLSRSGPD